MVEISYKTLCLNVFRFVLRKLIFAMILPVKINSVAPLQIDFAKRFIFHIRPSSKPSVSYQIKYVALGAILRISFRGVRSCVSTENENVIEPSEIRPTK